MKLTATRHAPWLCALAACAGVVGAAADEAERQRLRVIVQQQCVPHWVTAHDPAPCASVSSGAPGHDDRGYAVLADRKGGAHFLLIPTRTIRGIESPELQSAGARNYFAAAWQARGVLSSAVGHDVPREAVGLAVNHMHARSQDQLHIHISCLGRPLYEALHGAADRIGDGWTPLAVGDSGYRARRIMGPELGAADPFQLLAAELPGARAALGEYTLLVAGMQFREGPGFIVLAGDAVPGAELLLDAKCAVAG